MHQSIGDNIESVVIIGACNGVNIDESRRCNRDLWHKASLLLMELVQYGTDWWCTV